MEGYCGPLSTRGDSITSKSEYQSRSAKCTDWAFMSFGDISRNSHLLLDGMNGQRLHLSVHMFSQKTNNSEAFRCFLTGVWKQYRISPILLQNDYFFTRYHNSWLYFLQYLVYRGWNLRYHRFPKPSLLYRFSSHFPVWKTQTTSTEGRPKMHLHVVKMSGSANTLSNCQSRKKNCLKASQTDNLCFQTLWLCEYFAVMTTVSCNRNAFSRQGEIVALERESECVCVLY